MEMPNNQTLELNRKSTKKPYIPEYNLTLDMTTQPPIDDDPTHPSVKDPFEGVVTADEDEIVQDFNLDYDYDITP